ncbi:threonine/serine exporter family protein [Peribacillus acanthi]|uniref:threonine/serine exporter family protein n=1 Tax=Peribacillus acanthi TaxID=2171554 RepID=UPI000D3E4FE3|nr:threonine/serine exporter family protein [Peribacillus acanthi]
MMFIEQMITSFVASAAFGIIFNIPKDSVLKCGFTGMAGWICYITLSYVEVDMMMATAVSSFLVAIISLIFAKKYKTPIIIFTVGGIIPLVPGGMAYDAMRNFVENDYNAAINLAAKAFMISGAIAIGLVFSEVLHQLFRKSSLLKRMT